MDRSNYSIAPWHLGLLATAHTARRVLSNGEEASFRTPTRRIDFTSSSRLHYMIPFKNVVAYHRL